MLSIPSLRKGLVSAFSDDAVWGDRAILAAHGIVCACIVVLYGLSPRPDDLVATGPDGVWLFVGVFGVSQLVRGLIARRRALTDLEAGLMSFIEILAFYQLVWSFQFRYNHAPQLLLKTPALVFTFVLLAVQLLRFEMRQILITGLAVLLGWAALVVGVLMASGPGTITRAYVEYLSEPKILIGAAVEHGAIIAFITGALALGVYRGRMLQMREVRARQQAELAERVKTQFITNMSHELRTPLNAIIGYSDMVGEELVAIDQKSLAADCARIQASGKNLLSMVSQILDLSDEGALDSLIFSPVDVVSLSKEVLAQVETAAARNRVELKLSIDLGIGSIISHEGKLRQCLHNLLSNGVKFTHEGETELIVEREVVAGSTDILFRVKDTGIGIAPEMLDTIFEPFAQVDSSLTRRYGGAGLGLALARQLARQLGGEVSVTSRLGEGSIFMLRLPQKIAAPA